MTPRTLDLLQELDAACASRNLRLDFAFGHYQGTRIQVTPSLPEAAEQCGKDLLGFVFWPQGFPPQDIVHTVGKIEPLGLPLAILDEENAVAAAGVRPIRAMRVFTMASSRRCGLEMGRNLIRLGHRCAAYLCWEPMASWSIARLNGLRGAFAEIGLSDAVECILLGAEHPPDFVPSDFPPNRFMPGDLKPRERKQLRRALEHAESSIHREIIAEKRRDQLENGLKTLASDKCLTAWVASNDRLAIACTELLAEHGYTVPADKSVVGFDNVPEARYGGLTTYSFNPRAITNRLVDTVLTSPAALRREFTGETIEVPGYVCERRTTAAPLY
jgi:uncharacterized membrane protein